MDRSKAAEIAKDVMKLSDHMASNPFSLIESKKDNPTAAGYRIYFKTPSDPQDTEQIKEVAKRHGALVRQGKKSVIVYSAP